MPVSSSHILEQGPMLAALGKTAVRAIAQNLGKKGGSAPPAAAKSVELVRTAPAPSAELIAAYVKHVGGDPKAYRNTVPPHFFPQWVMPVASDVLADLPYQVTKIVNAGCTLKINAKLPQGQPLTVRTSLASVEETDKHALIKIHAVTGPASAPDALDIEIRAIVPLPKKPGNGKSSGPKKKDEKPRVPLEAREIQRSRLSHDAGLSFAKLTGDFNPIHWIVPAAKASGFKNVILHGYGTFARAVEALNRGLFSGDVTRLKSLDVRFTRPLVLPHDVGFFVTGAAGGASGEMFVGDAVGGPQFMSGRFDARPFDNV